LATFWQSNLHTTVHSAGSLTEERALLPDPALFRYTFRGGGLGAGLDRAAAWVRPDATVEVVGADAPAGPHRAIEPANTATAIGNRTVLDNRGCVLVARREIGRNREAFMGKHLSRLAQGQRKVHRGDSNESIDTQSADCDTKSGLWDFVP
jgi:hypothetical protein